MLDFPPKTLFCPVFRFHKNDGCYPYRCGHRRSRPRIRGSRRRRLPLREARRVGRRRRRVEARGRRLPGVGRQRGSPRLKRWHDTLWV